jgi:hypothetical protein
VKRVSVGGVSCRGLSNPLDRPQQEIGAENKKKILANLVQHEPTLRKTAFVDDQTKPSISNRAAPLFPIRKNPHLSSNSNMAQTSPWEQFKKEVNKTNPSPPQRGPTPPPDGQFIIKDYIRPKSNAPLTDPKYCGTDLYAALAKSQQ